MHINLLNMIMYLAILTSKESYTEGAANISMGEKSNASKKKETPFSCPTSIEELQKNPCIGNWIYLKGSKACVRILSQKRGFSQQSAVCKTLATVSELVSIISAKMDDELSDYMPPEGAWIGIKYKDRKMGWISQYKKRKILFHNFANDFEGPNTCAFKLKDWKALSCNLNHAAVCQKHVNRITIESWTNYHRPPNIVYIGEKLTLTCVAVNAAIEWRAVDPLKTAITSSLEPLNASNASKCGVKFTSNYTIDVTSELNMKSVTCCAESLVGFVIRCRTLKPRLQVLQQVSDGIAGSNSEFTPTTADLHLDLGRTTTKKPSRVKNKNKKRIKHFFGCPSDKKEFYQNPCLHDWLYLKKSKACVKPLPFNASFSDHSQNCNIQPGQTSLVTIASSAMEAELTDYIDLNAWIGLMYTGKEWRWTYNSTKITYHNFPEGFNGNEKPQWNCTYRRTFSSRKVEWHKTNCESLLPAICQKHGTAAELNSQLTISNTSNKVNTGEQISFTCGVVNAMMVWRVEGIFSATFKNTSEALKPPGCGVKFTSVLTTKATKDLDGKTVSCCAESLVGALWVCKQFRPTISVIDQQYLELDSIQVISDGQIHFFNVLPYIWIVGFVATFSMICLSSVVGKDNRGVTRGLQPAQLHQAQRAGSNSTSTTMSVSSSASSMVSTPGTSQ